MVNYFVRVNLDLLVRSARYMIIRFTAWRSDGQVLPGGSKEI
jgi:hypothetical protein